MMGLEIVEEFAGSWQEAAQSVATGMSGLGVTEMADNSQKMADALDIFVGSMQIVGVAASVMQGLNLKKTVEAVSGIIANGALGPYGWAKIGLAVGAFALASGVTYSIVRSYKLKANLSNPSEVLGVARTVGAVS